MHRIAKVTGCLTFVCFSLSVMSGNSADSFSEESDGEGEKSNERPEVGKTAGVNGRGPNKNISSPIPSPPTPSPSSSRKRRSAQIKSGTNGLQSTDSLLLKKKAHMSVCTSDKHFMPFVACLSSVKIRCLIYLRLHTSCVDFPEAPMLSATYLNARSWHV